VFHLPAPRPTLHQAVALVPHGQAEIGGHGLDLLQPLPHGHQLRERLMNGVFGGGGVGQQHRGVTKQTFHAGVVDLRQALPGVVTPAGRIAGLVACRWVTHSLIHTDPRSGRLV